MAFAAISQTLFAQGSPLPTIPQTSFPGKVIKTSDGDTVWFRYTRGKKVKVRLIGIDAPELNQAYGAISKKTLQRHCSKVRAELEPLGKDRYGRVLGKITCNGQNMNEYMVREGFAWAYRKGVQTLLYQSLEVQAKFNKKGLWSGTKPPIPPWEFRKHPPETENKHR